MSGCIKLGVKAPIGPRFSAKIDKILLGKGAGAAVAPLFPA